MKKNIGIDKMKIINYVLCVMFIIFMTGFIIYLIGDNVLHSLIIVTFMTFVLVIDVTENLNKK